MCVSAQNTGHTFLQWTPTTPEVNLMRNVLWIWKYCTLINHWKPFLSTPFLFSPFYLSFAPLPLPSNLPFTPLHFFCRSCSSACRLSQSLIFALHYCSFAVILVCAKIGAPFKFPCFQAITYILATYLMRLESITLAVQHICALVQCVQHCTTFSLTSVCLKVQSCNQAWRWTTLPPQFSDRLLEQLRIFE